MTFEHIADRVLFPELIDYLHERGVEPNQITVVGLCCSVIAAGLVAASAWTTGTLPIAGGFVALALLADALDGDLARKHDLQTERGAFLDFTSDKVSDILVYGSVTALCSAPIVGFAAISGDLLISGLSAKFESLSGDYVKAGIGGRGGGHVVLAVGVFATPFVTGATARSVPEVFTGILLVLAVMKYVTVGQRLRKIVPEIGRR